MSSHLAGGKMATANGQAIVGPSSAADGQIVSVNGTNGAGHALTEAAARAGAYEASLPPSDALPYFDDEINKPGMQAKVERELAAEMAKAAGSGNGAAAARMVAEDRLPPPLELFADNARLRAEYERVAAGEPVSEGGIDKTRYQLAAPSKNLEASEEEWDAAISNAETQLMHAEGRLTNVELLKKFGGAFLVQHLL